MFLVILLIRCWTVRNGSVQRYFQPWHIQEIITSYYSPHPHLQIRHCGSDVALGPFWVKAES